MTATLPRPTADDTPTRPNRVKTLLQNQFIGSALLALIVVLLWQIVSGMTFVIPSPLATVTVLFQNLTDPSYLFDMRVTAQSVVLAFIIGTAVGGSLGLALGLFSWLRTALEPMIIILNGIPKIVLYPVLLPIF
ncbi:MAG: transporter permease, partial [Mycobacterium sp.]|nr:transporter permease [Mycobacterium sp.]